MRLDNTQPQGTAPQPKQTQCRSCYATFTASAKWWFGKWIYGGVCRKCVQEMDQDKRYIRADGKEVRVWYE
jgi:hypothetical protein